MGCLNRIEILPGMLEGRERIYITLGEFPEFDERLMRWVSSIRRTSGWSMIGAFDRPVQTDRP